MSLTVPVVRAWRLETIAAQVGLLREDARVFDEAAAAVRHGADRQLDGLEGDTVTASARSCGELARDLGILANKTETLISALDAFQKEATIHRTKLLELVESAGLKGFAVNDDGSLNPPTATGDSDDPAVTAERARIRDEGQALHEDITAELRTLERIDLDAGNALKLMVMEESYDYHPDPDPDRSDNGDVRTTVAGVAISSQTDGLAEVMKAMGSGSSGLARALPFVGPALGFGIGVLGSSDEEPITETLVAEGAGVAAGAAATGLLTLGSSLATGAATGAAAGSVVPGIGTVAGLVVGGIAGYLASRGVREHFDDQRAQGKEVFS